MMYAQQRRASSNNYQHPSNDDPQRRPSLKEQPSYRDEASRALNRKDELSDLKRRLSSNRDILSADPSTKPWLRKKSTKSDLGLVRETSPPSNNNLTSPNEVLSRKSSNAYQINLPPQSTTQQQQQLKFTIQRNLSLSDNSECSFDY